MAFREDFVWGAATAAFQIEGGWNEGGKVPSIWDEFCHEGGHIKDCSSGDVACDHFHRYKEDVKLMSELGLKAYRFSISWPRIISDEKGTVNEEGVSFYNNLIDELLKYNITPFVTLYHWDLPYFLHLEGGWLNPKISDYFEHFAQVVSERFGDRVKNFITFNEPSVFTGCGYVFGVFAPGMKVGKREVIQIGHNIHLSHGKAVRAIRKNVQDAKIGFTVAAMPVIPASDSDEKNAFEKEFDCSGENIVWSNSFWMDPVVFGKYPEKLMKDCAELMPNFSEDDMKLISQKIDFIGLNIYQGQYAGERKNLVGEAHNELGWEIRPGALKWGPLHFYERYKIPIFITENGITCHDWKSLDGKVHDPNRTDFLHRYLLELRNAADSGCDIRGYFQWSFMDNFEWASGYYPRFGMVFCEYQTLERTPKDSAFWYKTVIESNGKNL